MLIDRTDPFTAEQAAQLRHLFQNLREQVKADELLSVFLINGDVPTLAHPVLSRCNPGDQSTASEWTSNRRRVQAEWRQTFEAPLDDLLGSMLPPARAQRSPIIETLHAVMMRAEAGATRPRRVIIFSDMLENTPAISHYGKRPDPARLAAQLKASGALPDLSGVAVEILYLNNSRDARFQGASHIEWWRRFLGEAGAQSLRFNAT